MTEGFIKFENGNAAKVCSKCNNPFRADVDFTEIDWMLFNGQLKRTPLFAEYCLSCKTDASKLNNSKLNSIVK